MNENETEKSESLIEKGPENASPSDINEEFEVIIAENATNQQEIGALTKQITNEGVKSEIDNELGQIGVATQEAISTFDKETQEGGQNSATRNELNKETETLEDEEDRDEIEIQNEKWMQKERSEREEDIRTTSDKYRDDLGAKEDTDLEQEQENARIEALKLTEELASKEKAFLDWIEKGASLNPENPEEINEYLRVLAEQLKQYSNILKYDYLKAEGQDIEELIDRAHFIKVMSIDKLGDLERLASKGIENWTKEDLEKSKGLIDWLKDLLPLVAAVGSIGAIINKIMNYMTALSNSGLPLKAISAGIALKTIKTVGMGAILGKGVPFGFLALIYAMTTEKQRDLFMEFVTHKKVPVWLRFDPKSLENKPK
jgi:hypothetical protein